MGQSFNHEMRQETDQLHARISALSQTAQSFAPRPQSIVVPPSLATPLPLRHVSPVPESNSPVPPPTRPLATTPRVVVAVPVDPAAPPTQMNSNENGIDDSWVRGALDEFQTQLLLNPAACALQPNDTLHKLAMDDGDE
jgi:hypothetical protein